MCAEFAALPNVHKTLESFADWNSSFWQEGAPVSPTVSRRLIKRVAEASETVDAILRHMVDDTINVRRRFVPASGFKEPSEENLKKLQAFFSNPNPDDTSDEWLENFVYDLILFGDAFWEKSGTRDKKIENNYSKDTWYAGNLKAVWHIPAYTMFALAVNKTGQLPTDNVTMCYQQKAGAMTTSFNKEKIARASRFKNDRIYGVSPLNSLLNIIAGQLNLTGYIGNVFSGDIPKTLLNVGKMKSTDFERLKQNIMEQLKTATNPYGILAINVPENFQLHKLMQTSQEGQFLDTLKYYREEICSVFGMPPSKMGWSVPGKLGSQDNMDDTYYDIVETIQRKVEKAIYTGIIKALGCEDWILKFESARPKKIKIESEARAKNARFFQVVRQEGIASVNECRLISELDPIREDWADDPRYPSPTVTLPPDPEDPEDNPDDEEDQEDDEEDT